METTDPGTPPALGFADVLHAVESWPTDQILALTRELAGSLTPDVRAAVVRELLGAGRSPIEAPGSRIRMSELRGSLPLPEGWPADIDARGLREMRLGEKH